MVMCQTGCWRIAITKNISEDNQDNPKHMSTKYIKCYECSDGRSVSENKNCLVMRTSKRSVFVGCVKDRGHDVACRNRVFAQITKKDPDADLNFFVSTADPLCLNEKKMKIIDKQLSEDIKQEASSLVQNIKKKQNA